MANSWTLLDLQLFKVFVGKTRSPFLRLYSMSEPADHCASDLDQFIKQSDDISLLGRVLAELMDTDCKEVISQLLRQCSSTKRRSIYMLCMPLTTLLPDDVIGEIVKLAYAPELRKVSRVFRRMYDLETARRQRCGEELAVGRAKQVQLFRLEVLFPISESVVTVTVGSAMVLHPQIDEQYDCIGQVSTFERALTAYPDCSDLLVVLGPDPIHHQGLFFFADEYEHSEVTIRGHSESERTILQTDCPLSVWNANVVHLENIELVVTGDEEGWPFHFTWPENGKKYAVRAEGEAQIYLTNCRLEVQHHGVLVADGAYFCAIKCEFVCSDKVAVHAQSDQCKIKLIDCKFETNHQCVQSAAPLTMIGNKLDNNRHGVVWREDEDVNEDLLEQSEFKGNTWSGGTPVQDYETTARHPSMILPKFSESTEFTW